MPNPTYRPEQLAPEVIKVGDKLHTALDEIAEDNGIFDDINTAVTDAYEDTPPRPILIPETFTENGTYVATDDNADGYSQVTVALPFESKTVTPSTTQQTVTPSQGYEALEEVIVEPTPLESVTVTPTTEQQTFTPQAPAIGFNSVTVKSILRTLFSTDGTCYQERIVFPDTVTEIADSAYSNCTLLNEVVFSDTVAQVGTNAFKSCSSLSIIDLSAYEDASSLPNLLNSNAFNDTLISKIFYVKNQTMLDAFASATNWSTYADRFQIKGV